MPEQLSATLDLSTTEAQSEINRLGDLLEAQLSTSAASFADAFAAAIAELPVVAPQVDTSGVTEGITTAVEETSPTTTVEADTTAAAAEIAGLGGTEVTVDVTADTSDAVAQIDDLSSSTADLGATMASTGESSKKLNSSAALLTGTTALATGEFAGLRHVMEGTHAALGEIAVGGGIVAGAIGLLTAKGIDATSAQQRFNTILGESADAVEHIHVGNLTANLGALGLKLGTTEAQMQQSTATIFQFATNAGASADKAVEFTNNLNALSARAVALNPSLGEVSDVAETMSTRLARGGRFAASFGISLTAAEINARALADTGKTTAADLTIYEKAAAGAELATEKYGNSLSETVAKGARNATIEQRSLKAQLDETLERLGKPLVAPSLDLLKNSIPIAEQLGDSLARLATAVLPVLNAAMEVLAPTIELTFKALDQLGISSTVTGAALGALIFLPLGPGAAAIGGLAGAVLGLAADLGILGGSADKTNQSVTGLSRELEQLAAKEAAKRFRESLGPGFEFIAKDMDQATAALRRLATQSPAAAENVVSGFAQMGYPIAALSRALAEGEAAYKRHDAAAKAATATNNAVKGTTDQLTQSTKDLTKAYNDNLKALDAKDDALRAQSDLTFAAIHAEEGERDAIDNITHAYKDAIDSGKTQAQAQDAANRSVVAAREAILRAANAYGDLAEKTDTSGNAEVAHQARIEATISHLNDVKNSLAPDSPLISYIDDYINKLRNEIPAAVTTTVDVNTTPAEQSLKRFAGEVQAAGGYDIFSLAAGHDFPGAQHGGPVTAGMTYLVGERGPELFSPGVSGQIIPNGGFTMGDPSAIAQAISDAINTGAIGGVRIDNLVVESPTPDPVRLGIEVARQLRAAQYLQGR